MKKITQKEASLLLSKTVPYVFQKLMAGELGEIHRCESGKCKLIDEEMVIKLKNILQNKKDLILSKKNKKTKKLLKN